MDIGAGPINPYTLRHQRSRSDLVDETQIHQSSPATRNGTPSDDPDPRARLPPGFNPTSTVDTDVDTSVARPVTHETRHRQVTEIVTDSITRDIHVDHYYHYVQPVKVVEIAPAKHYRISSKTGEKLSIAQPNGWEMPADMSVRKGGDISGLQWDRRDYVVDERDPQGRLLSPEELQCELENGHLVSPMGVGSESMSPISKRSSGF